jgi:hypothetical protein
VTESSPVPGGWYWFSNKEVHFRPENYWPAGEQVTLIADLAGFDAGGGVWGTEDHSVQFSVGPASAPPTPKPIR